jgi:hypothetical protein
MLISSFLNLGLYVRQFGRHLPAAGNLGQERRAVSAHWLGLLLPVAARVLQLFSLFSLLRRCCVAVVPSQCSECTIRAFYASGQAVG